MQRSFAQTDKHVADTLISIILQNGNQTWQVTKRLLLRFQISEYIQTVLDNNRTSYKYAMFGPNLIFLQIGNMILFGPNVD